MNTFQEFLKALNLSKLGGKSASITPIITVTPDAYASGDCIGGIIEIPNAVTSLNGTALLKSILVMDNDMQNSPITILFFNSRPTGSTAVDNGAFAYGTTFFTQVGKIFINSSDYQSIDSKSIANIDTITNIFQTNGTESLFAVIVSGATPTYTSGINSLRITFSFLQD